MNIINAENTENNVHNITNNYLSDIQRSDNKTIAPKLVLNVLYIHRKRLKFIIFQTARTTEKYLSNYSENDE